MRSYINGLLSMVCTLLFLAVPCTQASAKRVALVVGNDNYANVTNLAKAVNDANAMGETLEGLGYTVLRARNATRREMNTQIANFTGQLEKGDEALFFFAGHGVEIAGRNYLLPVDIPAAKPGKEDFVKAESVPVDEILDSIRSRGTRVSVLVLDACRDNPFPKAGTRSVGGKRGLAGMPAPEGTFIMYSAGVGQTALDALSNGDPNPNSVFTRSLIPLLKQPGLSLTQTARQVRRNVQKLASAIRHDQRPAYYDEVTGEFFFKKGERTGNATASGAARSQDDILWSGIDGSKKISDYEFYLKEQPDGKFAALASLNIARLRQAEEDRKAPPEKPVRVASDLRGTWECAAKLTTSCATITCETTVVVSNKINKVNFAGRLHINCKTAVKKGCQVPKGLRLNRKGFGAVSAKLKGKLVQVTSVADAPNEDLSAISEYAIKGDTLTYKRSLQGEDSQNFRETCSWIGPVEVASGGQQ